MAEDRGRAQKKRRNVWVANDVDPRRAGGGSTGHKRAEKVPRKRKGVGKTKEWILRKSQRNGRKGRMRGWTRCTSKRPT